MIILIVTAFLKTSFCTAIGQVLSMFEQVIVVNFIFYRNFKKEKWRNRKKN